MSNPYLIPPQSVISFSGGRTSGFMLRSILDAFGGELPADRHVVFANTGREMPETLDFVQECSSRWNVPIVWLEYDPDAEHKTAVVSHNSASRDGEPLAAIFKARSMLPNPTMRFCTIEGKIRRIASYARHGLGYADWSSIVGLRADEMRRVTKQIARHASGKDGKANGKPIMPLATAGVTKMHVKAFWDAQPFDLRLLNVNGVTPDGNCDLCFLKSAVQIQSTMRRRPETAQWWIDQEAHATARGTLRQAEMETFRKDRPSYAALLDASQRQFDLIDFMNGDSVDCACTD
jgi:3'-phosphoadenosine 5'-phosphosulfate sulfotransferase (PAPS reductase)/FAD synthetase